MRSVVSLSLPVCQLPFDGRRRPTVHLNFLARLWLRNGGKNHEKNGLYYENGGKKGMYYQCGQHRQDGWSPSFILCYLYFCSLHAFATLPSSTVSICNIAPCCSRVKGKGWRCQIVGSVRSTCNSSIRYHSV